MAGTLKFVDITKFAFQTAIKNFPSLLGCVVLWVLTIWIPYINVGTTIALLTLPAKLSKGEVISPLHIFDGTYRRYMGEFFLATAFKNMMISTGMMFMIVPGIILAIAYSLTTLLIVDKGRTATEALKESLDATEGRKGVLFLWYLFYTVALLLIPFWILSMIWTPLAVIYLIIASIAGTCGQAYIYAQLTGQPLPADQPQQPLGPAEGDQPGPDNAAL